MINNSLIINLVWSRRLSTFTKPKEDFSCTLFVKGKFACYFSFKVKKNTLKIIYSIVVFYLNQKKKIEPPSKHSALIANGSKVEKLN